MSLLPKAVGRKECGSDSMRYKENFKKGMVRLIISTGISYRKLSEMTTISQSTLKKWDDEYHQECLDERHREAERLKQQEEENMKRMAWHQYGSGAGRFE